MLRLRTIEDLGNDQLRAYILTRTDALTKKYKRIFKLEEESRAFETLKLELYSLRDSMRAASPGGTFEYTFLFGMIVKYVGRKYGLLTRAEQIDQLEIYTFVGEDIRAFEANYKRMAYSKDELRIVEEVRAIILSTHPKLHITRPV